MFSKINTPLFAMLIAILVITYFTKDNYKSVDVIMADVLKEPAQKELVNKNLIKFTKDSFEYELTPLYDYEISALIVHLMDYRWFSLSKIDNAIPMDVGLIWGTNVKNKIYQNKSVTFTQDCRFLYIRWSGHLNVNMNEISNNHMVVNKSELESKMKTLSVGDQVKIKGKLVNLKARYTGKSSDVGTKDVELQSSISRDDREGGACEIIYLEHMEILKKGNIISFYLFPYSFYGIVIMVILNIIRFFTSFNSFSPEKINDK
jgi:hypothetical protein